MLKRVRITGLGPHLDFRAELDPRGSNLVSGPSESGKSFLIEAVLFALYGRSVWGRFRPEAISDAQSRALVELTLDSGRTIRRTITRSRAQTRAIVLADQETRYESEAGFGEAIGELGADPDVVQLVMVPMSWQALSEGNARPLRDLLARILPGGGAEAEVARLAGELGFALRDGEARLDEKEVGTLRRDARRIRDEAAGRLSLAAERLAALEAGGPAAIEIEAPDVSEVAAVDAWDAWEAMQGARQARDAAEAARRDWDARRATLGDEPSDGDPGAAGRLAVAQRAMQAAWQQGQQLQAQLGQLQVQAQMFAGGGDTCPMCQRPGWEQGAAFAQQLSGQVQGLTQQWQQAEAAVASAQAQVTEATTAAASAEQARSARLAWRQGIAALGTRPDLPEPSDEVLRDPPVRPGDDVRARVAAWRRATLEATGLTERRQRERDDARDAVAQETDRHAQASAEATRLDTLLDLVRRAPSLAADQQARALGDLGPVTLEFGDNPAVRVLVDGRPWWLASRGRQVVADAALRSALRRAVQMPWLPLFVDNVQDVGGQPLPELDGPVVWLQTTDGKGIFVRRRSVRGESTDTGG